MQKYQLSPFILAYATSTPDAHELPLLSRFVAARPATLPKLVSSREYCNTVQLQTD
jgi:hypothetical protein